MFKTVILQVLLSQISLKKHIARPATGKEMVLFGNAGSFTLCPSIPRHTLGISVAEDSNQPGLIVTEVVEIGNAAMYGIEKGDVIVAVNGRTPQSGADLMEAVAQTNRSSLSLGIMSKTREYFEFEFPIPFRCPEVPSGDSDDILLFLVMGDMNCCRSTAVVFFSSKTNYRVNSSSLESCVGAKQRRFSFPWAA